MIAKKINLGNLHLNSWAGRTQHPVLILKETPNRYYVQFLAETCFNGRFIKGKNYYVPKHSVTI
jgi:hypothetical protein